MSVAPGGASWGCASPSPQLGIQAAPARDEAAPERDEAKYLSFFRKPWDSQYFLMSAVRSMLTLKGFGEQNREMRNGGRGCLRDNRKRGMGEASENATDAMTTTNNT